MLLQGRVEVLDWCLLRVILLCNGLGHQDMPVVWVCDVAVGGGGASPESQANHSRFS